MNNGKNLKNKFGEALYKSELMFDKIMNKQMAKVDEEIFRSTLVYDSASLVFLNRIRNKRTKWIAEDKRYRDYYKVVCSSVHKKKLNTLGQSVDPDYLPLLNDDIQYKFVLLQKHLKEKKPSNVKFPNIIIPAPKPRKEVSFYEEAPNETANSNEIKLPEDIENNESNVLSGIRDDNTFGDDNIIYTDVNETYNYNTTEENIQNSLLNNSNLVNKPTLSSKLSNVPKLPKIKSGIYNIANAKSLEEDFDMLYSKFSDCDNEFIEQLPAKVEIMDTNIGRRFIFDKLQKNSNFKKQKQKFNVIQTNALVDNRFQNLISYLEK